MTPRHAVFVVAVLICSLSSPGCATRRATINSYIDPSFTPGSVRSVAILPMQNARLAAMQAQTVNGRIATMLSTRNPSLEIVSDRESVARLNEAELADDWAQFLANYQTSGVPDASVIRRVGSAMRVDAVMQGELLDIEQRDGVYGGTRGQTIVTVRYMLLGTSSGNMLWEGTSQGIRQTATTLESAPDLLEAIDLAVDRIVLDLPRM
jgi:hypothetical protein